jgi:ABC-type nitrate/sulfonate/bicarbonate transport system substrate-binding protein
MAGYVALVKGFYAEEGLKVERLKPLETRKAVEQGRTTRLWAETDTGLIESDFGYFDTDGLHHMAAGRVDDYIVDGIHYGCQSVMVAPESSFKSVADLKGKKIEVAGDWRQPFLLHEHSWVNEWLKAPGFDGPRDLSVATIPWESLPKLNDYVTEGFKTGKFDAVAVADPRTLLLEDKHVARRLITQNDSTYNKEYCCLLVIKRSIVDTQPEKAARIVRAFRRARQWTAQNPQTAVIAARAADLYPVPVPVEASAKAVVSTTFDGQLDLAQALEGSFRQRIQSGGIKTDKTPEELVRLHYRRIE